MMRILRIGVLLSLFLLVACTRHSSVPAAPRAPQETVKSFIQLSAGAKDLDDKRKIQALCQGELRRTFERMTDEAFRLLYLDSKITIQELKILESTTQGDTAKIHYSVAVDNRQGTDPTREINEREVDLVRVNGGWFIESIRMRGDDRVAFTNGMIF